MSEISIIGLDLAKQVFQVHGADDKGDCVLRKQLKRSNVLAFFAKLSPCVVAMEACGTAHYWAREIAKLGHEVRLMPPAYVKPYVKRGKNDRIGAEAIPAFAGTSLRGGGPAHDALCAGEGPGRAGHRHGSPRARSSD
jgi:transposase